MTNDTPDNPAVYVCLYRDGGLADFGGPYPLEGVGLYVEVAALTAIRRGGVVVVVPLGPLCPGGSPPARLGLAAVMEGW